jgi:hypothetical protein
MAATANQQARLRRMVDEPSETTYDDDAIAAYIERYPLMDERGEVPYTWDTSTQPPTQTENDNWIDTYDLNAAAADIWDEKAGGVAEDFDFWADGGKYSRAQVVENYQARARYYRSRRAPSTMTLKAWPETTNAEAFRWIGNLAEED